MRMRYILKEPVCSISYTVTTDCLIVHTIIRLNLNWKKSYSSFVTIYKSKVKITDDA